MAFVVTIKGLYADAIKEVVEEITKKKLDDPKAVIVNNVPSFIDTGIITVMAMFKLSGIFPFAAQAFADYLEKHSTVEGGANACGLMTVEEIVEI